ncbi:reverse transcriptase domain-containing protein [Tanacetum coccineum]
MRELQAISSTTHVMMKFLTPRGIATLVPRTAAIFECRQLESKRILSEAQPDEGIIENNKSLAEEDVMINPAFPDQRITIGTQFSPACQRQLVKLLRDNKDVFAWQPSDMVGITRRVIQHSLNVNVSITPIAQKQRILGPEKSKAVMKEVEEWIKADFKNVNAACPKDYYPLSEIDLKIEAVMRFPFKCFLDTYKGYHQIQKSEEDEEKTAFYTDQGTYCYTKMSFGLKNAGETYQRLVDSAFQAHLGRNLEAYVDDMVIKSKAEQEMIMDIAESFDNLRKVNMKLNPKKCSFGVKEGKFLGYMATSEGIRANPKKTKAVAEMQFAERALPFFKTLKNITKENNDDFRWTEAAEQAFQEMKKLIVELPTLTTPGLKETLYVYLAASKEAVSGVLMADRKGKETPIRYVSRTLHEAERNYAPLEKLCYVYYTCPGGCEGVSEKLAKCAVELWAYNITYVPLNAFKGQVLTDFLNEVTVGTKHSKVYSLTDGESLEEWTLFTDGASSLKGAGARLVLIDPTGTEYTYAIWLNFTSINNDAEY